MTYHDSLLNRVERLAKQAGRTEEIVARLSQQEFDLRRARDAAVRELQELRSQRDTLVAEVATLRQQLHESNSSEMLTSWPLAAICEILNDSTGADGPGQS